MKLYIMRHGETDWNKERRLQGQADIPLNEFGREIAAQTGVGMNGISFEHIYTSPLVRAKETAVIVSGRTDVCEDDRLKEMSFGEYEGLCCAKDNWEIPDPNFEHFFFAPDQYAPPAGGDSFAAVIERVTDFLEDIRKKHSAMEGNILIVCHGVVVNAFLGIIKGRALKDFWDNKVQKNCEVNIAEVHNNEIRFLQEGVTYYQDEVKPW